MKRIRLKNLKPIRPESMHHRYGRSDSNVKPLNLPNRLLAPSVLALSLLAGTGCQIVQHGKLPLPNASCDAQVQAQPCVPRELDKATVPMYRVEPPDILSIDVSQQVSQASYPLQVGDVVGLNVMGTFPDEPIAGDYLIEAGGIINLGFGYGSLEVAGRTTAEAMQLVETHLQDQLREPQVSLAHAEHGVDAANRGRTHRGS